MSGRGRPIRFLALVSAGWIGARVLLLWEQTGSLPDAIRAVVPLGAPVQSRLATGHRRPGRPPAPLPEPVAVPKAAISDPRAALPHAVAADPARVQMAMLALVQYGAAEPATPAASFAMPVQELPVRMTPLSPRWSGSAWFVMRGGTGLGASGSSQLGGGQAGVRLSYLLIPAQRLAAFARVVAPLRGRGAEASVGLEWQPTRAPVRLVAEQRFGLDGVPGGPGVGVIAGFDAAIPPGFELESYGQAGALRRRRIEPYADGAVRLTRSLAQAERIRLALGAGAWGAAQRDAARLDIGPSATLALPLGKQNLRLALDWRQRIAGDARPGSGLALTLGSDF